MTLSKKSSDFFHNYYKGLKNEPYLFINLVFAGVILLIIAYAGIFSPDKNNYPVICIHEKVTGLPCFSCGLSHGFSLILRGRLSEAYIWNAYAVRVFLFFISEFIIRIIFSIYYMKFESSRTWLIRYDIAGSILIFAIAFYPFIRQLLLMLI
jgi:hypothetical protein